MGGVYWLPIDERMVVGNWAEVRGRRRTFELPLLKVGLEIREVDRGFDLHIQISGGHVALA